MENRVLIAFKRISNYGKLPDGLTIPDLRKPHLSHPRHVLLADVFYKAGLIESWGSGTLRINTICKKYSLPEVLFEQNDNQFSITFFSNTVKNEHENERMNLLLQEIKQDKFISINQLAKKVGVNRSTITRDLNILKKNNKITRIGSAKGGYWEILS